MKVRMNGGAMTDGFYVWCSGVLRFDNARSTPLWPVRKIEAGDGGTAWFLILSRMLADIERKSFSSQPFGYYCTAYIHGVWYRIGPWFTALIDAALKALNPPQ